jgi:hypothetical protein
VVTDSLKFTLFQKTTNGGAKDLASGQIWRRQNLFFLDITNPNVPAYFDFYDLRVQETRNAQAEMAKNME